ncbi:hypothetical protein BYT27DRAFT_6903639 [Phlegmacium glaucopus]|nr:hypothetical protein BYT27DRAFT_6903639 [Phlegmacium glaucopus]
MLDSYLLSPGYVWFSAAHTCALISWLYHSIYDEDEKCRLWPMFRHCFVSKNPTGSLRHTCDRLVTPLHFRWG